VTARGALIVFEGLDGAGTSTQLGLLAAWLGERGHAVEVTREPSNGPFGAVIRQAIEGRLRLAPEVLALAFASDRADHLLNEPNGVAGSLERGAFVLCDRYVLSSLAYQSADGVDLEWLVELNRHALEPDVTVFVDTPVADCLARIEARSAHAELFHERAKLERVANAYERALAQPRLVGQLVRVNGAQPPPVVFGAVVAALEQRLGTG
jgi:dTMP kinase